MVRNSIIAGNTAEGFDGTSANRDVSAFGFISNGANIFSEAGLGAATDTIVTPDTVIGAVVGVLDDYGGDTPSLAPVVGSPAIDAGVNSDAADASDQLGLPRIQGGQVDIGAVEGSRSPLPVLFTAGAGTIDLNDFDIAGRPEIRTQHGQTGNEMVRLSDTQNLGVLFSGGDGDDRLFGGVGNDRIEGGSGNDFVDGGFGNDRLDGGDGADTLLGGDGDDSVIVRANLVAFGENGGDVFIIDRDVSTAGAVLNGGEGRDTLRVQSNLPLIVHTSIEVLEPDNVLLTAAQLAEFSIVSAGASGRASLQISDRFDGKIVVSAAVTELGVFTSAAADRLTFQVQGTTEISYTDNSFSTLGSGDDVWAGGGNDTLNGGVGADEFRASGGDDRLLGQGGDDILYGQSGNDIFNGGTGSNRLIGSFGNDQAELGLGDDVFDGGDGIDRATYGTATGGVTVSLAIQTAQDTGGGGRDTLMGVSGPHPLIHERYADRQQRRQPVGRWRRRRSPLRSRRQRHLAGLPGNDVLDGGVNADRLVGGTGADRLIGGTDFDVLVFRAFEGSDRIADFQDGIDRLELGGFGRACDTPAEVLAAATQVGADTVIRLTSTAITIEGLLRADFDAADSIIVA